MTNIICTLLVAAVLLFAGGCRVEIGGIASINEAAEAANDPNILLYPFDKSRTTHLRDSDSEVRTQIIGLITNVPNAEAEGSPDSSTIQIIDINNGRKYGLRINADSFARDLGVHYDGRIAKIIVDVELNSISLEIRDDIIVQYGPNE